jgi:hypothetical protein
MRIAILTSARSGSTSLYHLLEEILGGQKYLCISEPFNSYWRNPAGLKTYDVDFFKNRSKVFIKTFVSELQRPVKFINDEKSYWDWFFDYFDKVIILDRKNKDLQSESLTYHMKKRDMSSWQRKQYYDLSNISKREIDDSKTILIKESEKKHAFSKIGYPIFYFEDIFIDKKKEIALELFDYLGLEFRSDLYEKYINSDLFKIRLPESTEEFKKLI